MLHVMILVATVMLINDDDGKHDIMDFDNIWAPHSWSQLEHIRSSTTHFCTVPLGSPIVYTAPPLLILHSLCNLEPTGHSDVIWHELPLDLPHTTPHCTAPHHTTPHHTTPHHTSLQLCPAATGSKAFTFRTTFLSASAVVSSQQC